MTLDEYRAFVDGIMTVYKEANGAISSAKVLDLIVDKLQTVGRVVPPGYFPRAGEGIAKYDPKHPAVGVGGNVLGGESAMAYANVPRGVNS